MRTYTFLLALPINNKTILFFNFMYNMSLFEFKEVNVS